MESPSPEMSRAASPDLMDSDSDSDSNSENDESENDEALPALSPVVTASDALPGCLFSSRLCPPASSSNPDASTSLGAFSAPQASVQHQSSGTSPVFHGFVDNRSRHDYQIQLMLLEQQNKKRLMMARQEQEYEHEQEQDKARNICCETSSIACSSAPAGNGGLDQRAQSKVLEQPDQKRIMMARDEQKQYGTRITDHESSSIASASSPAGITRLDYQAKLRILEEHNKERLRNMRRDREPELDDRVPHYPVKHSPSAAEKDASTLPNAAQGKSLPSPTSTASNIENHFGPFSAEGQRRAMPAAARHFQPFTMQQNAMIGGLGVPTNNEEPPAGFDFDSFLGESEQAESSSRGGVCSTIHSEPCNAAATSLLGSTMSREELGQIQIEKRWYEIDQIQKIRMHAQQEQMHQYHTTAQEAMLARQMARSGHVGEPPVHRPQPQRFPMYAPIFHTPSHPGPTFPTYRNCQALPTYIAPQPQPSYPAPGSPGPTAIKRGAPDSSDLPNGERSAKRPNHTTEPDRAGEDTERNRRERSTSLLSNDSEAAHSEASTARRQFIMANKARAKPKPIVRAEGRASTDDAQPTDSSRSPPPPRVASNETTQGSPAQSSATLDAEDARSPLVELDIDQENVAHTQKIEFDLGVSVTTMTWKDGATKTIMHGGGDGKSRDGVEIVTKTVIANGVVTVTTTTALIPLGGAQAEEEVD